MGKNDKKKSTGNGKGEDGRFRSKNIKHDAKAESARAVFGLRGGANDAKQGGV